MNSEPARSPAHRDGAVGDWAARLLGWPGVALPEMTLLGVRLLPVVVLDQGAHRARAASGDGPQLDGDTIAVWEWPESVRHAPASAVTLSGLLVPARGTGRPGWRRALNRARSLRGFGPAAVLAVPEVVGDEVRRLEHALHGIGLVPTTPDPSSPLVHAAPGRGPRARRRTADQPLPAQEHRAEPRDRCAGCQQPMVLRPAIGDPDVLLWVSRDDAGVSVVTCYGTALTCELCAGTGDDLDDPEWACEGCDGLGLVSDADHEPAPTPSLRAVLSCRRPASSCGVVWS